MTKKNILILITVFLFILLLGFANHKHFDMKHEQLAKEISSNILVGEVVDSHEKNVSVMSVYGGGDASVVILRFDDLSEEFEPGDLLMVLYDGEIVAEHCLATLESVTLLGVERPKLPNDPLLDKQLAEDIPDGVLVAEEILENSDETQKEYSYAGKVIEVRENGYLTTGTGDIQGEVLVQVPESYVLTEVLIGQEIVVKYDGLLKQSFPQQLTASEILVHI